ncbi:MAG TPA: prepilin-type N-terminal cleavage/methylation domain-containing protein [Anaeromyxobacteraceae bacterium]|nr:prepilin-type N-terminal cleavage/methylation domain-containing protein [Anaeromyxobacteraceae bacterium]
MSLAARPGGGFTLLEVLIALTVLAGSLLAISDLAGNAIRNYAYARDLSVATLLAREKMAELEERYEDSGFRDFDETQDGDFADQGRPEFRWKLEVRKPDTKLSADQLLAVFLGANPDDVNTQELLSKLLGGQQAAGGASSSTQPAAGIGGAMGGIFQTQLTAFGEDIKKAIRELRLVVSWKSGKREESFDVSTYLVVLNPKAPGGAHGADPDIPPGLTSGVLQNLPAGGLQGPNLGK